MIVVYEVMGQRRRVRSFKGINYYEFYLHSIRDDAFNINARSHPDFNSAAAFGKSCKVRRQFNKNPVVFDTPYYTGHGFACGEICCILLPGSEQFFVAQQNPVVLINRPDDAFYLLPSEKSVVRRRNARDRNVIDWQQSGDSAADICKAPELFNVSDLAVYNIYNMYSVMQYAGTKIIEKTSDITRT